MIWNPKPNPAFENSDKIIFTPSGSKAYDTDVNVNTEYDMNHKRPATAAAVLAFEKNTLTKKQKAVVAMLYTTKNINSGRKLEYEKTATLLPCQEYVSMIIISKEDIIMQTIERTNQAHHCSQFGTPTIFIASFNCISFSNVMNLTVFTAGYTKLSMIISEMRCSRPVSSLSSVYLGYGYRFGVNQ